MEIKQFSNKNFNRELISLAIPIALQNLISAAVNSADVFMLGSVNQTAMSAVSLAGQISFVLMLFLSSLAIGAGVLSAQYWGKKDTMIIERVLNIASIFTVTISVLFFIASFFFPEMLMKIFTSDVELISYGASYQRILSWSYLAMGLSQIYLNVIKSMGNAKFSASVSASSLIINVVLNAICILVLFPGKSENAIVGVAVSTVIARFTELAICFIYSKKKAKKESRIRFRVPIFDIIGKQLLKDYIKYTSPILANYVVWGTALTFTAAIIGHVSSDMVAANSVASVIRNLAIVFCGGISSGGAVLVGKYLGTGDKEFAKKVGNRVYIYALAAGVLAGGIVLLIGPFVFNFISLNETASGYLQKMLYVCAYYCIGKAINSTVIGGIFSAGGDAKFSFWCDTIVMWGIIIPLGYMSAFVWNLNPVMLYIILSLDEIIKIPIATIRFKQYKWLNNITRDFKKE